MHWVNFLHVYQPINQADDILEMVVNQSYRKIFRGLFNSPNAKVTLNISGALSELLLQKGYQDVIDAIRELAQNGTLEFTETAKNHAFLPFLPEDEIERSVLLNHETNKAIFGSTYNPVAFFPPEMAYDENVGRVVGRMGYKIIILDEIAYSGKVDGAPYEHLCRDNESELVIAFRERRMSNLIVSAVARNKATFLAALGSEQTENRYLMTGMDGETFGHHRPGLENTLFELVSLQEPTQCFVSELLNLFPVSETIKPVPSTWAASEYDIENKLPFHSWNDPDNAIHKIQWELFTLVLKEVKESKLEPEYASTVKKLDYSLASDQFFWASNRPWWSMEMIEQGAWQLLDTMQTLGENHKTAKHRAKELYEQIIYLGFTWQREGKIRKESHEASELTKIPFRTRTLESDKPEVYQAFFDLMQKKEKDSAMRGDYEEAILWRDALWKLDTKNDIYDAIHVTDLLRARLPHGELEKLMDRYRKEYKKIRGGQGEDRLK